MAFTDIPLETGASTLALVGASIVAVLESFRQPVAATARKQRIFVKRMRGLIPHVGLAAKRLWWDHPCVRRAVAVLALASCMGDESPSALPDAPITADAGARFGLTVDELRFAVVGDTRPATVDDTAGYPTAIISTIWQDVEAERPHPAFAVATGDYMYVGNTNEQNPQLDAYFSARTVYSGPLYAALGNHECNTATESNCGSGSLNGRSMDYFPGNYRAFLDRMVTSLGVTTPWYSVRVRGADGSFTAKIVIVAANAWVDEQAAWLEATMAEPTDYTFVVRHEPSTATQAPGTHASQAIISRHPYTLLLVGHSHRYAHVSAREVIIGNGGAPLTGSSQYGYVIVRRRPDGAIELTAYEYLQRRVMDSFVVGADGSPR
jgi:hypothetical protein